MIFKRLFIGALSFPILSMLSACSANSEMIAPSQLLTMTSNTSSISAKMIEASGVVYAGQGNYLVISDEAIGKAAIYLMDSKANLQSAVPINAKQKIDDLESVSRIDSKLLVCSSASATKQGKLKKKRRRCLLLSARDEAFKTEAAFDLFDALNYAAKNSSDKDVQSFLKKAFKRNRLDIEAHAIKDGELLIGFKNPLLNGKAVILSLDSLDHLLAGKHPSSAIWHTLDFGNEQNAFRLSDMTFLNSKELLLTTSGKTSSALWRFDSKTKTLNRLLTFSGAQAEGVTYDSDTGSAVIVFDGGNGKGSQAYIHPLR